MNQPRDSRCLIMNRLLLRQVSPQPRELGRRAEFLFAHAGLVFQVNRNLELARAEKALGASLEAKVLLHCADPAVSEALARWSGASNGVDELRFLFLTSQVELHTHRHTHTHTHTHIHVHIHTHS